MFFGAADGLVAFRIDFSASMTGGKIPGESENSLAALTCAALNPVTPTCLMDRIK